MSTFAPIDEEVIKTKKFHREFISVDKSTAKLTNSNKSAGKKNIAGGTTVIRTLESFVKKSKVQLYQSPLTQIILDKVSGRVFALTPLFLHFYGIVVL